MEINSRCAVLRALKKKRVTYDVARRFQQQLLNAAGLSARPVSMRNSAETQFLQHFQSDAPTEAGPTLPASELSGSQHLDSHQTNGRADSSSQAAATAAGSNGQSDALAARRASMTSISATPRASYGEDGARGWGTGRSLSAAARAAKVAAMTGQSEEQRIAGAVQGWLMSPSTKEGRARARFVEAKFPALLQSTLQALSKDALPGSKSAARLAARIPQYRPGRVTDAKQAQKKPRHKGATLDELRSSQLLAMDSLYGGEVRFIGGAGNIGNAPSTLHSVQRGVVIGSSIGRGSANSPSTRAGSGIRVLSNDERMLSRTLSSGVDAPPLALAGASAEGGGEVSRPPPPPLKKGHSGPLRRRRSVSMTDLPPPGAGHTAGGGFFRKVKGLFSRKKSNTEHTDVGGNGDGTASTVVSSPRAVPSGTLNPVGATSHSHSGAGDAAGCDEGKLQPDASFRDLITGLGPLQDADAEDSEAENATSSGTTDSEHRALEDIPEQEDGAFDEAVAGGSTGDLREIEGNHSSSGAPEVEVGAPRDPILSLSASDTSEGTHSTLGSLNEGIAASGGGCSPPVRRQSVAEGGSPFTAPAKRGGLPPVDDEHRGRSVSMAAFDWIKNRSTNTGSGTSKGQGSWGSLLSAPETPDAAPRKGGMVHRSFAQLGNGANREDDAFVEGLVASATPSSGGGGVGGTPSTGSGMAAWSRARTRVLAVVRLAGSDGSPSVHGGGTSSSDPESQGGVAAVQHAGGQASPSTSSVAAPTAADVKRAEWRRAVFASPAVAAASRQPLHGSAGGLFPLSPPPDNLIRRSTTAGAALRGGALPREYFSPSARSVSRNLGGALEGEVAVPVEGGTSAEHGAHGAPTLDTAPIGPGITRSRSVDAGRSSPQCPLPHLPRRSIGGGVNTLDTSLEGGVPAPSSGEGESLQDIVGFASQDDVVSAAAAAGDSGSEGGGSGSEGGGSAVSSPSRIVDLGAPHHANGPPFTERGSTYAADADSVSAQEVDSNAEAVSAAAGPPAEMQAPLRDPLPPLGSAAPNLPAENACESLRRFMDGLHDHILQNREGQLKALQIQLPYFKDNEGGIVVEQGGVLGDPEEEGAEECRPGAVAVLSTLDTVSAIAMRAVEVACYSPLKHSLLACLECTVDAREESGLLVSMAALRRASQESFNIPEALRVPDLWAAAVLELREAEVCELPSDKLRALMAAARAIYAEYGATERQKALLQHIKTHPLHAALIGLALGQHSPEDEEGGLHGGDADEGRGASGRGTGSGSWSRNPRRTGSSGSRQRLCIADLDLPPPTPLGADDFFPVFTFVVVRAQLSRPLLLKELLWALCDPLMLQGEGGYYLTMYEAALEYIRSMDAAT